MSEELGVDIDCRDDLPPTFSLASGLDNLGNAIARGLQTPAGFLADIDPEAADWGYDLRGKVNSKGTQRELQDTLAAAQAQILRDPRVQGVDITNIFDRGPSTAKVTAVIETTDGPFSLILGISDVDVKVLGAGAGASAQDFAAVAPSQSVAAPPTQIVLIPGPQGPPGPPGTGGGGGGGGGGGSGGTLDDPGEFMEDTTTEQVAWQDTYDFGAAVGMVNLELIAQVKAVIGSNGGTFRLYVGGTDDAADGALVATITAAANTVYTKKSQGGVIANPGGLQLVKITAVSGVNAKDVWLKALTVKINAGSAGNTLDDAGEYAHDTTVEVVAWQDTYDFGAGSEQLQIELIAQVMAETGSGGGTFKLRIGGTDMAADGTVVDTITAANGSSYTKKSATAIFDSPGGLLLVKATIAVASDGFAAWLKALAVKIS